MIFVELALALWLQVIDNTLFSGFAVMIVITKTLLTERPRFCIAFSAAALAASTAAWYLPWNGSVQAISPLGTILLPRLFIILAITIARYNIVISERNRRLTELLKQKTDELELSLGTLKTYADDLKETADLRTRDCLLRNLHDTLGHTLTTAFINAQAVTVLIDQDAPAAKARQATVTQQIQAAIKSLRDVLSGKTMDDSLGAHTAEQFLGLIQETEKRTEITIHVGCFAGEAYSSLSGAVLHRYVKPTENTTLIHWT